MRYITKKIIVSLTAAGLLIGTPLSAILPGSNAQAAAKSASATKQSKPSKAIVTAAEKALKDFTGRSYSIGEASQAKINGEMLWDLRVKGVEFSQVFMKDSKVRSIKIEQKWSELKPAYQQQIQQVMKQALVEFKTPDSVSLSIDHSNQKNKGEIQIYVRSGDHIIIIHNGKLTRHTQILTNTSIDPAILEKVQGIFKGWSGVKQGELQRSQSSLTREGDKEVYKLAFGSGNNPVYIDINKATGVILKVDAPELQGSQEEFVQSLKKLNSISEAQLLKQAIKQAPALLQLDLNGYTAKKDPKMTGIVHFTKPGAPTVSGQYNTNGEFYIMERTQ
ncbi:hypothetical protein [Paenibacillus massiliensis]|uniref:hypothetical protein n=1 Tax=Paenibacillus massiliensis TaxID=225917 RepID=UPI000406639A|nr:hypothetical protein [Paenibacillus massiliensis]